jgi:Plavaka transposase
MAPEKLELWRRDPVECVKDLMGNPAFADIMHFAPEKIYTDPEREDRQYDEMWTGDWWWNTQVRRIYNVYVTVGNRK